MGNITKSETDGRPIIMLDIPSLVINTHHIKSRAILSSMVLNGLRRMNDYLSVISDPENETGLINKSRVKMAIEVFEEGFYMFKDARIERKVRKTGDIYHRSFFVTDDICDELLGLKKFIVQKDIIAEIIYYAETVKNNPKCAVPIFCEHLFSLALYVDVTYKNWNCEDMSHAYTMSGLPISHTDTQDVTLPAVLRFFRSAYNAKSILGAILYAGTNLINESLNFRLPIIDRPTGTTTYESIQKIQTTKSDAEYENLNDKMIEVSSTIQTYLSSIFDKVLADWICDSSDIVSWSELFNSDEVTDAVSKMMVGKSESDGSEQTEDGKRDTVEDKDDGSADEKGECDDTENSSISIGYPSQPIVISHKDDEPLTTCVKGKSDNPDDTPQNKVSDEQEKNTNVGDNRAVQLGSAIGGLYNAVNQFHDGVKQGFDEAGKRLRGDTDTENECSKLPAKTPIGVRILPAWAYTKAFEKTTLHPQQLVNDILKTVLFIKTRYQLAVMYNMGSDIFMCSSIGGLVSCIDEGFRIMVDDEMQEVTFEPNMNSIFEKKDDIDVIETLHDKINNTWNTFIQLPGRRHEIRGYESIECTIASMEQAIERIHSINNFKQNNDAVRKELVMLILYMNSLLNTLKTSDSGRLVSYYNITLYKSLRGWEDWRRKDRAISLHLQQIYAQVMGELQRRAKKQRKKIKKNHGKVKNKYYTSLAELVGNRLGLLDLFAGMSDTIQMTDTYINFNTPSDPTPML